jgi:hypothetical protein
MEISYTYWEVDSLYASVNLSSPERKQRKRRGGHFTGKIAIFF